MSLLNFLLYDFISFIIHIFIILFAYRLFSKHKCNIFSKIAEKQIQDYWGTIESDKSITDVNTDDLSDFVDSIKVLDEDESQTSSNTEQPRFF